MSLLIVGTVGKPELAVIGLLFLVVLVLAFWKIFKKAGFSPWLGLLMLVPFVNFLSLCFLAFSDWPALKRTEPR